MRTSIPVDRQKLEAAIAEAEKQPHSGMLKMLNAASIIYNLSAENPIAPSTVGHRIKQWNLKIKTTLGKRGRARQEVDTALLTELVASTKDFNKVSEEYKLKTGVEISGVTLRNRASELNLLPKKSEKSTENAEVKVKNRPDRSEIEAAEMLKICGCQHRALITPSGKCPVVLNSTDRSKVSDWMLKLLDKGHNSLDPVHYSPAAMKYFVRHFYEYGSPEHREICEMISEISENARTSAVCEVSDAMDIDDDIINVDDVEIDLGTVDTSDMIEDDLE